MLDNYSYVTWGGYFLRNALTFLTRYVKHSLPTGHDFLQTNRLRHCNFSKSIPLIFTPVSSPQLLSATSYPFLTVYPYLILQSLKSPYIEP